MLIRMNYMLVIKAIKKKKLRTLFKTIISSSASKSPSNIKNKVVNELNIVPKFVRSAP